MIIKIIPVNFDINLMNMILLLNTEIQKRKFPEINKKKVKI